MPQKAIIDYNLELTLKKFAKAKGAAASSRVENEAIGWFRPEVGRLVELTTTDSTSTVGAFPPSTTLQVWVTNPNAKGKASATITTTPDGKIGKITINDEARGSGFLLDDTLHISPVDPTIARDYPGIRDVGAVPAKLTWEGFLLQKEDLIHIHSAFATDEAEKKLIEAYTVNDAGNSSDGIVLSLQIDYLAQAERAYRARATQNFPRMLTHLASREKGHGQPTGVFLGQALDYFILLLKQGADASGGSV